MAYTPTDSNDDSWYVSFAANPTWIVEKTKQITICELQNTRRECTARQGAGHDPQSTRKQDGKTILVQRVASDRPRARNVASSDEPPVVWLPGHNLSNATVIDLLRS